MSHCLIVEDNEVDSMVLEQVMKQHDYEVVTVENGQQALIHCDSHTPKVIFLDWMMPYMDGPEFLEELRDAKSGDTPYIIVCTGKEDEDAKETVLKAGANAFIKKPISAELIDSTLTAAGL